MYDLDVIGTLIDRLQGDGLSYRQIAAVLNEQGYCTSTGNAFNSQTVGITFHKALKDAKWLRKQQFPIVRLEFIQDFFYLPDTEEGRLVGQPFYDTDAVHRVHLVGHMRRIR